LDPIIRDYHGIGSRNNGSAGSSSSSSTTTTIITAQDDSDFDEWIDPELPNESNFISKKIEGVVAGGPTLQPTIHYDEKKMTKKNDNSGSNVLVKSGGIADDDQEYYTTDENDVEATATTTATTTAPAQQQQQQTMLKLRRHPTIINNPRLLITNRQADPLNKYILSTRIRVARSLVGYRFPSTMTRCERRQVEQLVGDCVSNLHLGHNGTSSGTYRSVLSMTSEQNQQLISTHVLFDNPNEWTIACGLGRDWPDGRSVYANVPNLFANTTNSDIDNDSNNNATNTTNTTTTTTTTKPDFMIWVNEEDHLRIMCLRSGGDIQGVFATLTNGVRLLERELRLRNVQFVHDYRLGYLTSCPTNVGTAMRASVHVKLVKLGKVPGFFQLVERLKLEVRGKYGETDRMYTGIFDISNLERLGKSEVHLINVMVEGVAKLIDIERRLEAGEEIDIDSIA
jgi:creatine kinase